ncbi:hypothetical protein ACLOJK_002683 [Asimina triloba]
MGDPTNLIGSSFKINEEQKPCNLYHMDDPGGLFTNTEQNGLPSSQTHHRVQMHQIPHGGGNAMSVNSLISRAVPLNNAGLAAGPQKISPDARLRPPRMIPSHFQPKQLAMPSISGNAISQVDQFSRLPPYLGQNQLGINGNTPSGVLLGNPVRGIPESNASLPTMPIGGNPNQSAHGFAPSQIRSRGPGRPPSGLRAVMQQHRGNAAVVIPTNSHPISGDTERPFDDAETYRRHETERQLRMKHEIERLLTISERDCVKLSDTSSSLQSSEQNQVLCDQILQLRDYGQLNNAALNPFEDLHPPVFDAPNGPKMHEQKQFLLSRSNTFTLQAGHDDNLNKDSQDTIYNWLDLPYIGQHHGYLHNITDPDRITHSTAPVMPANGQAVASNGKKAKQASQFTEDQMPLIASDERPTIQQHDGSLSNIRGPNDPLFFPHRDKQYNGFALPSAGSDLKHVGSMGLGRSPNSSLTASGSISGNDQSGKPNLSDEGESAPETKRRTTRKRKLSSPAKESTSHSQTTEGRDIP